MVFPGRLVHPLKSVGLILADHRPPFHIVGLDPGRTGPLAPFHPQPALRPRRRHDEFGPLFGEGFGGAGGGINDIGGSGAGADAVDGRDAVVAAGAGGQPGVLVGGGGAGGVGDQVGPGSTAIDGDLDLVAGDDAAAVVDRGGPREVDRVGPAGGCREARRGVRGDGRQGGVVGDGGDAVHAGGEGRGVVAGGVLDGQGVVASGGVGVGDDDDLALADEDRAKRERETRSFQPGIRTGVDLADRHGNAVCSDREGGAPGAAETPCTVSENTRLICVPVETTVALVSVGGVVSTAPP